MIKYIFGLWFLFFSIPDQQQAQWQTIISESGKYSIEMPSIPKEKQQTIPSDIGNLILNIQILDLSSSKGDNLVFSVNYTDYPKDLMEALQTEEQTQQFLIDSREGAVANINGSLVSSKEIEITGGDGLRFDIAIMDGAYTVRMNYYLVGIRVYAIQVISKTDVQNNDDSKRFFDSFKLIESDK